MAKTTFESIDAFTYVSPDSRTMNILSSGTDDIVTESGVTIGTTVSSAIGAGAYTTSTATYVPGQVTTMDTYIRSTSQSISTSENSTRSITADLSCSYSGSTSIVYSTSMYGSSAVPSWVSIDSSTGSLTVTTPSVSTNTLYSFYVDSVVSGLTGTKSKLIKLTVADCQAKY